MTKRDLVVASTRYYHARLLKYYPRRQCAPSLIKSRFLPHRAVFKWLSKVITWLRLLRLVIGLKDSRQFFNQWEAKPKPIAPCTRDISRASGALQVIARNCDWFMELFVPVVIGRSNCFGFGFSTVIWKPLYYKFTYSTYFLTFWNSLYVYTREILGCLLGFWPLGQNPAGAIIILYV